MKKGYFFLLDGIFAIIVLVIGFMLISSNRPDLVQTVPVEFASENFVDLLSTAKINDLCSDCKCSNKKLEEYCSITNNYEQTIIDFFGELYSGGKKTETRKLFQNFTYLIREDLYGVELKINNEIIYSDPGKEKTKELISSKKVIFGFAENHVLGKVRYWGPYVAEVNLWEK